MCFVFVFLNRCRDRSQTNGKCACGRLDIIWLWSRSFKSTQFESLITHVSQSSNENVNITWNRTHVSHCLWACCVLCLCECSIFQYSMRKVSMFKPFSICSTFLINHREPKTLTHSHTHTLVSCTFTLMKLRQKAEKKKKKKKMKRNENDATLKLIWNTRNALQIDWSGGE